ncbi:hypothetical protein UZJ15_15325 [Escherichia coli]|nr:hypothetical protein [Escherichia coli]MDQ9287911.1 hypothetical protein [Escherichia coli]MDQ9472581.1 hypothetical protein [Escherichia coli]MDW2841311.1 hypothetical protein [Escherichia coli]MDW9308525.1 hypothetical protein [Escherichia coli]MDY3807086.1 hypothetical protein [Escherichia coli]
MRQTNTCQYSERYCDRC